jgi:hypothetical protein
VDDISLENIQKLLSQSGNSDTKVDDGTLNKLKDWANKASKLLTGMGFDSSEMKNKITDALVSAGKKGISGINELLKSTIGQGFTVDTVYNMLGLDTFKADAENTLGALKGVLQDTGIIPIELSLDSAEVQVEKLKEMIGKGGLSKLAISFGATKLADQLRTVRTQYTEPLTKDLDDLRITAGAIFAVRSNPFGAIREDVTASTESLKVFQQKFAREAIALQFSLGIDATDAKRELQSVYAGLDDSLRQLSGFSIKSGDQNIEGAEAVVVAAKAIGVEVQEITGDINEMTSRFGLSGEQAAERIMTIGKASAASGLSMRAFKDLVMDSAGQFGSFGDATEESAALLERFTKNASRERMKAVTDAFKGVASGIAGMTDEMKAFVSMGTELSGGGGAIESIVRLEEAMQSGDKDALQGIFDETMARIEELTGSPLMTMQEAVSSGQESTFYQQAALAKQFGFAGNRAQASDVFSAYRTGTVDIGDIKDRQMPADLGTQAREKMAGQMGAGEMAENLLRGVAAQQKFNALWADTTTSFMAQTQDLGKKLVDITGQFTKAEDIISAYVSDPKLKQAAAGKDVPKGTTRETAASAMEAQGTAGVGRTGTMTEAQAYAGVVIDASRFEAGLVAGITPAVSASIAAATAAITETVIKNASNAAAGGAAGVIPAAAVVGANQPPVNIQVEVTVKGSDLKDMIEVKAKPIAAQAARWSAGMPNP